MDTGVRDKILKAAIKVFAKEGYRGAGIRRIANEAGVNSAMISYYFKTKQNLYETVLGLYLDDLIDKMVGIREESLEGFLKKFTLIHMEIVKKRGRDIAFLTLREYVGDFKGSKGYLKEKTERVLGMLYEHLGRHVVSRVDLNFLITIIIFSDIGLSLKFSKERRKKLSDYLVNVLLNGLSERGV